MSAQPLEKTSQAKLFGIVGSVLALLTFVPNVVAALGVVGLILLLLAVRDIAEVLSDMSIFRRMLTAVIAAVVGVIVGAGVVFGSVLSFFRLGGPFAFVPTANLVGLIFGAAIGLAVVWVAVILSAVWVRRSYGSIAADLNIRMFGYASTLYLIGAVLTVVLVGFVIIEAALVLQLVAFARLPSGPLKETIKSEASKVPVESPL